MLRGSKLQSMSTGGVSHMCLFQCQLGLFLRDVCGKSPVSNNYVIFSYTNRVNTTHVGISTKHSQRSCYVIRVSVFPENTKVAHSSSCLLVHFFDNYACPSACLLGNSRKNTSVSDLNSDVFFNLQRFTLHSNVLLLFTGPLSNGISLFDSSYCRH